MRKNPVIIRLFKCTICENKLYASKYKNKLTSIGHIKTMYCPFCQEERDCIQIDNINTKGLK